MNMDIGKVGIWFFLDAMPAPDTVAFAKQVEKAGYNALWIPEAVGREPFAHAAHLLSHTNRLTIATGIANIWARDAITMAAASNTVAEQSGGRFLLGIGVSHKPLVTNLRGHSYDKPYSFMKEYLPKMKGALYVAPKPKEPVKVVLAALHPKMLALSASEANGTHTYFVPPEHTAKARALIGPNAMLCAAQAKLEYVIRVQVIQDAAADDDVERAVAGKRDVANVALLKRHPYTLRCGCDIYCLASSSSNSECSRLALSRE